MQQSLTFVNKQIIEIPHELFDDKKILIAMHDDVIIKLWESIKRDIF
jgi:hypothetical protein